jgi:hypothetical protein
MDCSAKHCKDLIHTRFWRLDAPGSGHSRSSAPGGTACPHDVDASRPRSGERARCRHTPHRSRHSAEIHATLPLHFRLLPQGSTRNREIHLDTIKVRTVEPI